MILTRIATGLTSRLLSAWDVVIIVVFCTAVLGSSAFQLALIIRDNNAASNVTAVPVAPTSPVLKIQEAHLFDSNTGSTAGMPDDDAGGSAQLRGVMVNEDAASSYAMIEISGAEKTYQPGEKLPDGSKVDKIFSDHIVLSHNGKEETLKLRIEAE